MSRVTHVTFGRHAEVSAVLADPRFAVAAPADEGGPMGWLRSQVSRFSTGATHQRRRARTVPVRVLAEAIGVRAPVTAEIAVVARGYQPGTEAGPEAAAAMAHLVQACGGAWDERTAARPDAAEQLTLGAGLRPCPGRDHAFAIATGVLETLLPSAVSGMDTLGVQEEER
jgi:hypothetical protein